MWYMSFAQTHTETLFQCCNNLCMIICYVKFFVTFAFDIDNDFWLQQNEHKHP